MQNVSESRDGENIFKFIMRAALPKTWQRQKEKEKF